MFEFATRLRDTRTFAKARSLAGRLALCAAAFLAVCFGRQARATVQMAESERRACQYCHLNGSPGSVDATLARQSAALNARGLYYAKHEYSFKDYVEPTASAAAPTALFRSITRDTLPGNTRRVAVADVKGDRTPRLITLDEKPDTRDSSVLTIKRWDGKAFVTEFSADTPGTPDQLAVGRFTLDSKTVILTSRAAWYWNGKTYTSKPSPQPINLIGTLRSRIGSGDSVLATDAGGDLWEYRVSIGAGGDVLTGGHPLKQLTGGDVSRMDMHGSQEFFAKIQLQSAFTQGGILGLMTGGKSGRQLLYHAELDQDIDIKNPVGNGKAQFVLKSQGWKVGVDDPRQPTLANHFYTPRLAGDIYDVATESAHGDGATGLLILTSATPDGKGRSLYFFALNTPASTTIPASN